MSTPKTLPMKSKAMHYALLAFITQSNEFASEMKVGLIAKLPVLETVENQILFYDKLVDFKTVENDIVKPMIKKRKHDESNAAKPVKETKKRATAKKTVPVQVVSSPGPAEAVSAPDPELYIPKLDAPVTPVIVVEPVVVEVAENPKKKRVVKKKEEQPPKMSEQVEEQMNLTDEMKEESYLATATAIPTATDTTTVEHFLIIRNTVRYWTTDEFEKNGLVFEDCCTAEGDSGVGELTGDLKDGILRLY